MTYQGGSPLALVVTGATNGGSYGSTLGTLNGGSGRQTLTLDLTGDSNFQGKKTFQFKLTGQTVGSFELEDISFIFRDLGAR